MLQRILGARYAPVAGVSRGERSTSRRGAPIGLTLAAALCLILVFFELFIVFFQVTLAEADDFDNDVRTAYTTGISLLATLLAFFVTSEIRNGWLRWIDYRLATDATRASYRGLDRSWRANLGFMSFGERLVSVSSWPIQLIYLFAGLLAAAFISATTPTLALRNTSYSPWIPKGTENSCAGSFAKKAGGGQPAGWATGEATWSLSDTTNFAAANRTDSFRCPLSQMPGLMSVINNEAPQKMAYSVDGIAVQGSAVGAPEILFSAFYNTNLTTGFRSVLADKGTSLDSVSQCAPVLKKNPFKCQPDPKGTTKIESVGSSSFGTFSASTDGCAYSQWYNGNLDNGTMSQLMSGQFCAGSGPVGTGLVVVGGFSNAAVNLALMVGDLDWAAANWQKAQGYTVRCEVDVGSAIGWRQVSLALQNGATADAPYGQVLSGGADCPAQDLGPAYAATAAAVAGKVLTDENENVYFPKTLIGKALNQTGNHPAMYKADPIAPSASMMRTAPWALSGSRNGLEDVLGVTAGVVMSKMIAQNFTGNEDIGTTVDTAANGGGSGPHVYSSASGSAVLPALNLTGSVATVVVRMGPGRAYAVVYAVPALLVALAAVFLLVKVPWHREHLRSTSLLEIMQMNAGGEIQMNQPNSNNNNNAGAAPVLRMSNKAAFGSRAVNIDHDAPTGYKEEEHRYDGPGIARPALAVSSDYRV